MPLLDIEIQDIKGPGWSRFWSTHWHRSIRKENVNNKEDTEIERQLCSVDVKARTVEVAKLVVVG
jgi:hypothetical protein